jgi:hypothetical protein
MDYTNSNWNTNILHDCIVHTYILFWLNYSCLKTVGASISHNPMGLHGLLQGYLYFYLQGNKYS